MLEQRPAAAALGTAQNLPVARSGTDESRSIGIGRRLATSNDVAGRSPLEAQERLRAAAAIGHFVATVQFQRARSHRTVGRPARR